MSKSVTKSKAAAHRAVDRMFDWLRKKGIRRVKESGNWCEDRKGNDAITDPVRACRVCAIESANVYLLRSGTKDAQRINAIPVSGALMVRGDSIGCLRTVPNMPAMRKLYHEAVELKYAGRRAE